MPARNQPSLLVRRPGLLTTVQDMGRFGYQRYGVPVSGAMDRTALRLGNRLVGNADDAAGLELTIHGPELEFIEGMMIAVTGADLSASLNHDVLPLWEPIHVRSGDVLRFGNRRYGSRAYVCVHGGLDVPMMFGGRATDVRNGIGGLEGRRLMKGDCLHVRRMKTQKLDWARRHIPAAARPAYPATPMSRVVLSSGDAAFPPSAVLVLFTGFYVLSSESDRTGYRLRGAPLGHHTPGDVLSAATAMGTIQVPPDQQPIVLMADCQPTGGYPQLGSVITVDLPCLGQLVPGDKIQFTPVTLDEAINLYRTQRAELDRLLPPIVVP